MATIIPEKSTVGVTGAGADLAAGAAAIPVAKLATGSSFALAGVQSRVIDVGGKTVVPTVVRGGEEVKSPALNTQKVEDLVGRLVPITRVKVPRAVAQSIPAGTRVPKGTPVDLVLVPVSDIDFSLLDHVHDDFKAKSIEALLPVVTDPQVEAILKKDQSQQLTDAEKTVIRDKLTPLGIAVDDSVPTKSFDLAFQSLQSAKAFR